MKSVIASFILFLLFPAGVFATTWYVDDDGIYPGSGTPSDPFQNIEDAIDVASNGDTILVLPGNYYGAYIENMDITLRSDEDGNANTYDIAPETTRISSCYLYYLNNSVIDGFTLNDPYCWLDSNSSPTITNNIIDYGLYITSGFNSSPTISNNTIEGGVIIFGENDSFPTINNNTIEGNYYYTGISCWKVNPIISGNIIRESWGGEAGGISVIDGSPIITYNTIVDNGGQEYGGGIYVEEGTPTITNNIIMYNEAESGGGIYLEDTNGGIIQDNWICANSANDWGGGIVLDYCNDLQIKNNTINQNFSFYDGGGIYCSDLNPGAEIAENEILYNICLHGNGGGICCLYYASPAIKGNRIVGNQALYGNGGGIDVSYYSDPVIFNNLIARNFAYGKGGGIECYSHSSPSIANNTLFGNEASMGGAINCEWHASPSILNTILWGNYASISGNAVAHDPGTCNPTVNGCDVEGGWPGGTANLNVYPEFEPGPDSGYYLTSQSPCINAGIGLAATYGLNTFWTGKNGVPDTGTVDVGFHFGPFTQPWGTLDVDDDGIYPNDDGGYAIFYLDAGPGAAHRTYVMFASVTGTFPGTPLPGGMAVLPLNWDVVTDIVLTMLNTPVFQNSYAQLDQNGFAEARLVVPQFPLLSPVTLYFAYSLYNPFDFASNPVEVQLRIDD